MGPMRVLATAGHVDHGKSALARALTGMEPDRFAEERRRGLTLDLGFVWTRLDPPDGEHLALVDVPGHERFVATMLAGVGPVPAVLFVVAADQGWQEQSQEHLDILDALGVRHAVLAVTRSDLADPGPVRADAARRLAATTLGAVPTVAVSAVTGGGVDRLRKELATLARALPVPPADADVRLWLDRCFTVRGHGTVVTGTLGAGTLRTGDRLVTGDGTTTVRVRALQCLNEERDAVGGVARVAVNVHGAPDAVLGRGQVLLTPDRWLPAATVDVRIGTTPVEELPRASTLHIGTAAVPVTVRPLGADTARLTLARELPLRIGDRAVLREPGGRRHPPRGVTVLDVRPPPLTRRGAARTRAAELDGMTGRPDGAAELRRRLLVRRTELEAMGAPAPAPPVAGDWLADPEHWTVLRNRLGEEVARHAVDRPLEPGLPTEEARRLLELPDRALVDALADVPGPVTLSRSKGRLHRQRREPVLPPPVRAAVDTLRKELERSPFHAPEAGRLAELGLGRRELAAAVTAGALLRVGDGIVLLPGADTRAAAVLRALPEPFTLSAARRALDTTRRVAVPLLEFLDEKGLTERVDDQHRRCRSGGGRESNPPARDPRAPRF